MSGLTALVLAFGAAYLILSAIRHHIQMLQQNGYRLDRYFEWYSPRWAQEIRRGEFLLLLPFIFAFFNFKAWCISQICVFVILLLIYWPAPKKDKKPLAFTKRAIRLYALTALFALVDTAFFLIFPYPVLIAIGFMIMCGLSWVYVVAAAWILAPVEKKINNGYLRQAADKITALPDLIRIGITGSFGKTSTKLILAAVLSEKYQTLATPGSFNTPMGVTRVIRETLSPIDEIFICEMGAKQRGDIAELCSLVQPKIGVLTAIGEQHLESFGSLDAIIDTKFELIESLPADGLAVVNGDDQRIAANLGRCHCRLIRYGPLAGK